MRVSALGVAMVVLLGGVAWTQDQASDQAPQQPPTLGPQPAPSLRGPRTSQTHDPRKLMRVRKIYVKRMDNKLHDKLLDGLGKMARFSVVADPREADAILRGTCFDSRRLRSVHSEVYLNDQVSGASIWQDSVRRSYNPPPLDAAVTESAKLILEHLSESVVEAELR